MPKERWNPETTDKVFAVIAVLVVLFFLAWMAYFYVQQLSGAARPG